MFLTELKLQSLLNKVLEFEFSVSLPVSVCLSVAISVSLSLCFCLSLSLLKLRIDSVNTFPFIYRFYSCPCPNSKNDSKNKTAGSQTIVSSHALCTHIRWTENYTLCPVVIRNLCCNFDMLRYETSVWLSLLSCAMTQKLISKWLETFSCCLMCTCETVHHNMAQW